MKKMIFLGLIAGTLAVASCSNNTKTADTTSNPDTAVLVQDTANKLNASPVNDTTVHGTVKNQ